MPFTKGHPFYRSKKPGAYASKTGKPRKKDYVRVALVPDNLRWKPAPYGANATKNFTVMFSFGNTYKLVRVRATGEVWYYKLRDDVIPTPKHKIDAEPLPRKQVHYHVGKQCWFVDAGRWFLVQVISRTGSDRRTFGESKRIVIKPVTGFDADNLAAWPYPAEFKFPSKGTYFKRLRPLRDRCR